MPRDKRDTATIAEARNANIGNMIMVKDREQLSEHAEHDESVRPRQPQPSMPKEIGGPKGPEPTRYGDWERNGRCSDF